MKKVAKSDKAKRTECPQRFVVGASICAHEGIQQKERYAECSSLMDEDLSRLTEVKKGGTEEGKARGFQLS